MTEPVLFYKNFEAALGKLTEFKTIYDGSEIHRAGMIQAFEFTFEQCWKAIQKRGGTEGLALASPKKAIEWAMSSLWFPASSESTWLEMMSDRNLTSQTYRDQTAQDIVTRVLNSYIEEFVRILDRMKQER